MLKLSHKKKSSLPEKVNQSQQITYSPIHPTFKQRHLGRKLLVRFFAVDKNENGYIVSMEYQGEKLCKYGDILIEWKDNEYKINYDLVIAGKKYFEYNTDSLNAIGGLSFYEYPETVNNTTGKVIPSQAKEYHDAIVESAFVGSRGIPKMWLLICIIATVIAVAGLVIMSTQYAGISTKYTADHTALCGIDPTHIGCPPPKPATVTK